MNSQRFQNVLQCFSVLFQAAEFFLFGCLMVLDMALLGFLASRFTYVNIEETIEETSESSGNNNENNIPLEEKPSKSD